MITCKSTIKLGQYQDSTKQQEEKPVEVTLTRCGYQLGVLFLQVEKLLLHPLRLALPNIQLALHYKSKQRQNQTRPISCGNASSLGDYCLYMFGRLVLYLISSSELLVQLREPGGRQGKLTKPAWLHGSFILLAVYHFNQWRLCHHQVLRRGVDSGRRAGSSCRRGVLGGFLGSGIVLRLALVLLGRSSLLPSCPLLLRGELRVFALLR